ncbi:MAG: hypothetical protein AB8B53_15130 [Flavobacteriales bacterium]
MNTKWIMIVMVLLCNAELIKAQYNDEVAGQNRIYVTEIEEVELTDEAGNVMLDKDGEKIVEIQEVKKLAVSDVHGNADGNQFDLATDGAFKGNTIAVLNLCGVTLDQPEASLSEKGFSMFQWKSGAPEPEILRKELEKSCQLWVISNGHRILTDEHVDVIEEYFHSGKGLYIWGDNAPLYADANAITERLFNTTMNGDFYADQVVGISGEAEGRTGIVDGHLISTGVVNMYEGITIATVKPTQDLYPLIYNSQNGLVAAVYEKNGKRCIIDGGFTRLYYKWEAAGTNRYVKNAAAWLVNVERFGDEVLLNSDAQMDVEDKADVILKVQKDLKENTQAEMHLNFDSKRRESEVFWIKEEE